MFNLEIIKIIRYFLLIANINKMTLFTASIKMHFFYYLAFFIGQKYFNILKSVLYIKNLAVS